MKTPFLVPWGGLAQGRLCISAMPGQSIGRAVHDGIVLEPLGQLADRAAATPVQREPTSLGLSPEEGARTNQLCPDTVLLLGW